MRIKYFSCSVPAQIILVENCSKHDPYRDSTKSTLRYMLFLNCLPSLRTELFSSLLFRVSTVKIDMTADDIFL